MEDFKGTRGEWFVSGQTQIVSMPSQTKISKSISGNSYEEARANAQLISAAQELLKCLQRFVTVIERDEILTAQNIGSLREANVAISKAIGGPKS